MKPHVIVRLKRGVSPPDLPHWAEILRAKPARVERFTPAVDRVLREFGLATWAAHEYRPSGPTWSSEEAASGLDRIFRLILQREKRFPPGLVAAIRLLPEVEDVRPGEIVQTALPRAQTAVTTDDGSRQAIYLGEAHHLTKGRPDIKVAVLDTGIDIDHRELGALEAGSDFVHILDGHDAFVGDFVDADPVPEDDVGHGTHVAGILAGQGKRMPPGVAPRCQLLPVRVLAAMAKDGDRIGAGLIDNINVGVKWAVDQGAEVLNMSLGIRHEGGGLPHQEVIEYALRQGVTVVAAAGNDGREHLYYPGALPGVIAVGAVDRDGTVSGFSTYGRQVALVAPGEEIYSSYRDGGYAFASGTSHAAPFVSGAVALLKSLGRELGRRLSDRQVKHLLKHTCDRLDDRFRHPKAGYGRLNLVDALRLCEAKLS